ncbi:MAG: hypothetical protein ABJT31_11420 [Hyphomicrobiales bacterium]
MLMPVSIGATGLKLKVRFQRKSAAATLGAFAVLSACGGSSTSGNNGPEGGSTNFMEFA